jgi:hypothetical protein
MQVQPVGAAVNNSNSGALMLGSGYDFLNSILSKVPFGKQAVIDPLRSLDISLAQRQAQNISPSLLMPQQKQMAPIFIGPAMSGLLAAPDRP